MEQLISWSVFCLVVLLVCLVRPPAGRIFVGIFFLVMAVGVNLVTVFVDPDSYVGLGADSYVPLYRWVFTNLVSPPLFVLPVAAFEIAIALSMLFAASVFQGSRLAAWIRVLMIASGVLAGLSGVVVGEMQLRNIGIVGYVGVFLVVAALLALLFYRATPPEA